MKLEHLTHKSRILLLALAINGASSPLSASPIEQIGDRYIVHVPELDLRGDESLMDILLMCPDVISLDSRTTLAGDPLANLYGKIVIRFDNVEYGLDYNTLLHNLKAREIEKIQVCINTDVMKGTGSQKKVIDIHLRKDVGAVKGLEGDYYTEGNNGKGTLGEKISGRLGLFGDTYGGGEAITSVRYHGDNLRILSHMEGNMQRSAIDGAPTNHRSHEGAKVTMSWDITSKDNLMITATQTYTRNRLAGYSANGNSSANGYSSNGISTNEYSSNANSSTGTTVFENPADYSRYYNVELDYLRTLSKNGASMLFTLASDHAGDNGYDYHNRSTFPYTILEFNFPLFTPNLWITAGFEGGLSYERDCIVRETSHSDYEDFYAQADLTLGKWGFMVGDRYRRTNTSNHNAYTLSTYYHINAQRTLQASFSQQFYNAALGDIAQKPVYRAELKHTFQKKNFFLSTMIRYIDQDLNEGKVKTFNFGNTLFWHIGMLRLTAGLSTYKEELRKNEFENRGVENGIGDRNKIGNGNGNENGNGIGNVNGNGNGNVNGNRNGNVNGNRNGNEIGNKIGSYNLGEKNANNENGSPAEKINSQYFVFKLAPQLSLPGDWRLTATMLWSTHRNEEGLSYTPANLYAEAAVYKTFNRHWLLEARYHDIAGQHLGNRAATIGCTYYF